MDNKILDNINEEIARIGRALEMLNASKGKNLIDEQNRVKTRNLLSVTQQNLKDIANELSKPRIMESMATSASNAKRTKSTETKLGK